MTTETTKTDEMKGSFFSSLTRNNSKIRADRAASISEDAQLRFKRTIEDMVHEKKKLLRERDNMLDLSPTTATSLVLASDFSADDFVAKDLAIGIQLRELDIKLDIAGKRYEELFGEKII